ncbi:hypothetical protein ACFC0M_18445 [Streptomyces sp. NPDC056149]|uniref:hypothetical protein n=1 Tax=unclassified Streptomyces TaxID=2593676 RepID=UPI0023818CBD|nr:hypothetical protein [Streptomyces sp. WZ-12]
MGDLFGMRVADRVLGAELAVEGDATAAVKPFEGAQFGGLGYGDVCIAAEVANDFVGVFLGVELGPETSELCANAGRMMVAEAFVDLLASNSRNSSARSRGRACAAAMRITSSH